MPQRRSHFPGATSSTSALKQKRALSQPPSTSTRRSRRSKRVKSSPTEPKTKITPEKSPYFKNSTCDSEPESKIDKEESGYEDEDASAVSSAESELSSTGNSSVYASEDEKPTKKKRGGKPGGAKNRTKPNAHGAISTLTTSSKRGSELWRPGIKVSGEGEVFIPLPKARSAGSTPYTDGTLHPNTLLFLSELAKNNDREWLKMHDANYRQSLNDWHSFVDSLTPKIIEKDETIPELPHKDLTFRIYRDIRFSPDPTPYKTHFSAAWSRTGRKGPYAAYYVQIQPKASFVGAGVWHPEAASLALLRKSVDRHGERLKGVLNDPKLRKEFLGGVKGERECVKKFVQINGENALKTKPRDYEATHADIALLRLRNYTIGKKLKDEEVLGKAALERIAELIGVLTPFVTLLNSVVMPDEGASSDEDDEAEDDEASSVEEDGSDDEGNDEPE